jgi:hypothetical protein
MLFGRKDDFAVECVVDEPRNGNSVFGGVCLWVMNHQIGYVDRICVVNVFAQFIRRWTSGLKSPLPQYQSMNARMALEQIERRLYHCEDLDEGILEFEQLLRSYVLCPGGGESFDGDFCIAIPIGEDFRVIWKRYSDSLVFDELIRRAHFQQAVFGFLKWFDELAGC